jgi:hypothetical protein
MARIRSLKPEFFRSRTMARVSRDARLTFQGLWCEADDAGNGVADPRILKGALWPLDDDIGWQDVARHLDELEQVGAIRTYRVRGEDYYSIPKWAAHQSAAFRRGEARYPGPDEADPLPPAQTPQPEDLQDSARGRVQPAPGSVLEQGAGSREQGGESNSRDLERKPVRAPAVPPGETDPPEFVAFWDCYPRRVAQGAARRAWRNAVKKADPVVIVAGAREFRAAVEAENRETQFVPHPATWLNGERWADEITESYWDELARWAADDVIDVEPIE